ncbi:MAG: hypothetical protein DRN01_05610, partial [Thermoplasmata archaeon]
TSTTVGTSTLYSSVTTDPERNSIKYEFDWGDNTRDKTGWVDSGTTVTSSHQWDDEGTYTVRVRAYDGIEWSDWSKGLTVVVSKPVDEQNHPPNPPSTSTAMSQGYVNETYTFTIFTIDPDEDDKVQCMVDWGDGGVTGWSQYVSSGETISYSHTWKTSGTYVIKAKSRDEHDASSAWVILFTVDVKNILDEDNDGVPDAKDPFPRDPENVEMVILEGEKYYLVNGDQDSSFEYIYNPRNGKLINLGVQGHDTLIDINDDGEWDYLYSKGDVLPYESPKTQSSFTYLLYIAALLAAVILGGGFYYVHHVSSGLVTKRFTCPACRNSIELKGKRGDVIEMVCPYCHSRGIVRF